MDVHCVMTEYLFEPISLMLVYDIADDGSVNRGDGWNQSRFTVSTFSIYDTSIPILHNLPNNLTSNYANICIRYSKSLREGIIPSMQIT